MCSNPDDMYSKRLADRARYLKNDPEGVDIMCQVMEELRDESIQRGVEMNRLESIKTVLRKLKYTAQQAMEFLDIPEAEQPKYLAKI